VPGILQKRGETIEVKTVDGEEFKAALLERIKHDAHSVATKPSVEAFADLQESLNAAAHQHGCSQQSIKTACRFKRAIQGSYLKGLVIIARLGRSNPSKEL